MKTYSNAQKLKQKLSPNFYKGLQSAASRGMREMDQNISIGGILNDPHRNNGVSKVIRIWLPGLYQVDQIVLHDIIMDTKTSR